MSTLKMLFGHKTTVVVRDDGKTETHAEFVEAGKITSKTVRYSETVKINSESQVLREFIAFMDYVRADRSRRDPEFKCITDPKTGRIFKAYKLWTEPES